MRARRRRGPNGCGRRRLGGLVEPGGLLRAQAFIRILLLLLWWRGLGLRSCGLRLRFWRRRRRRRRTILRGALVPDALRALLLDDGPPCTTGLGGSGTGGVGARITSGSARRSSRLGSGSGGASGSASGASGSAGGGEFRNENAEPVDSRPVAGGSGSAGVAGASGAGDGGFDASCLTERPPKRSIACATRARADACDPGGAVDAAVERC